MLFIRSYGSALLAGEQRLANGRQQPTTRSHLAQNGFKNKSTFQISIFVSIAIAVLIARSSLLHFSLSPRVSGGSRRPHRPAMAPPSSKSRLKSAKSLIDSGDFASALSLLDALLLSDASLYHAHVLRGVALRASADLPAALAAYSAAVALRPDAPLAHKGIIDAVPHDEHDPARCVLLARAHAKLGGDGLAKGADILFRVAVQDDTRVDEAVGMLGKAREEAGRKCEDEHIEQHPSWRIAHLLAATLPDDAATRSEALLRSDCLLSAALDDVERLLRRTAMPVSSGPARRLCEERAVARCMAGQRTAESLSFLRVSGSYEALLSLAESSVTAHIPAREVINVACRALHAAPQRLEGRARFVLAAELARRGVDKAVAEKLAGIGAVKAGAKRVEPGSCVHALVVALLRLGRGENKLALEAARAGQRVAEREGDRERYAALLGLLAAAALVGERKYKEGIKEFGKARVYGQRKGDAWVEKAANKGLVDTAVVAHGRKSRLASTAVEEAAGSTENDFGVLECAWTDALVDDVDSERMAELKERAVEKAKSAEGGEEVVGWEYQILVSRFIMSDAELAGVASTRLGQMLIKEHGAEPSVLARAQKCQMDAANLFKGLPNPFAHLGWIFEQMAKHGEAKKMSMRAIRCYEKALTIDAAHPLASRRMARMLIEKGLIDDATLVAREASDQNPKARWAHNIVGWSRIAKQRYSEASVSFRNALRGRPKLSARAEEALYGTDVGRTEEDNDLVVDADSWRGLSAVYKRQGKVGPAVACIDDGLALLRNPPLVYLTAGIDGIAAIQDSLGFLLDSERSMLLQLQRNTEEAKHGMESVLRDSRAPVTIKSYLSEAHVYTAAKEWISGCYSRATMLRIRAARILESSLAEHQEKHPQLNPSSILKRCGDTLMEVVTPHPRLLEKLVQGEQLDCILSQALLTYCKAMHYAPWDHQARRQDLAAAMLRTAVLQDSESLANQAVNILVRNQSDPSILAMSFLTLAMVVPNAAIGRAANQLALRVSKSIRSKNHVIALNASITVQASTLHGVGGGAENAIAAVRHDPTDWRGWYAVAAIRETDARKNNWPLTMIRSSEDAYKEADRLGGGPCAVHGIVRCLTELLHVRKRTDFNNIDVYGEACFCASTASRIGLHEPPICREVIDEFRTDEETKATAIAQELAQSDSPTESHKHVHLYPFLPEVAALAVAPS